MYLRSFLKKLFDLQQTTRNISIRSEHVYKRRQSLNICIESFSYVNGTLEAYGRFVILLREGLECNALGVEWQGGSQGIALQFREAGLASARRSLRDEKRLCGTAWTQNSHYNEREDSSASRMRCNFTTILYSRAQISLEGEQKVRLKVLTYYLITL